MENKNITLDEWLAREGRKAGWFATQVGVSEHAVSMWRRGHRAPSTSARILIETVTHGAVKAASWVTQPDGQQ